MKNKKLIIIFTLLIFIFIIFNCSTPGSDNSGGGTNGNGDTETDIIPYKIKHLPSKIYVDTPKTLSRSDSNNNYNEEESEDSSYDDYDGEESEDSSRQLKLSDDENNFGYQTLLENIYITELELASIAMHFIVIDKLIDEGAVKDGREHNTELVYTKELFYGMINILKPEIKNFYKDVCKQVIGMKYKLKYKYYNYKKEDDKYDLTFELIYETNDIPSSDQGVIFASPFIFHWTEDGSRYKLDNLEYISGEDNDTNYKLSIYYELKYQYLNYNTAEATKIILDSHDTISNENHKYHTVIINYNSVNKGVYFYDNYQFKFNDDDNYSTESIITGFADNIGGEVYENRKFFDSGSEFQKLILESFNESGNIIGQWLRDNSGDWYCYEDYNDQVKQPNGYRRNEIDQINFDNF